MPVTKLPELDRTSATFRQDCDSFFGSKLATFSEEINALEDNVNAKEASAVAAANTATTKANDAVGAAIYIEENLTAINNAPPAAAAAAQFRNEAEQFALQAIGAAASLEMPAMLPSNAGQSLIVNQAGDGWTFEAKARQFFMSGG